MPAAPRPVALPEAVLAGMAARGPDWAGWVDSLPGIAAGLLAEWELTVDWPPMSGFCSIVLSVRTPGGRPAALKIAFPDDESEHEHLALQHWGGRGTVELLRADPRRRALLLERLHHEDLNSLWDLEACEIVAGLYSRIHLPAPPRLRTLSSYVDRWRESLTNLTRDAPLPPRLVEQAIALAGDFVADKACDGTMIHGDLHYQNVLAADREPWLVIDPKPMSGDPHYELAPMLWNRCDELAGNVRDGIRRRFHTLVDAADLDQERARDWVVLRMMLNATWALEDAARLATDLSDSGKEWVTMCVTIAKAVQD
ncbi:MAG: aminoglycoside phosphotransferase family protein [Nocardioides sp.]|nr:aminoglycoside phosphotransferase family protein [Nocardioides sp.]